MIVGLLTCDVWVYLWVFSSTIIKDHTVTFVGFASTFHSLGEGICHIFACFWRHCRHNFMNYWHTINNHKRVKVCRVIFDNYGRENSIKDIIRRCKLGVLHSSTRAYNVDDICSIHGSKLFLANNETKNSLTFYLTNKVLQLKIPVVTVTRLHVKSNMNNVQPSTGVSTQEEADTLIILHAAEISKAGENVHITTQDTYVMVLALRRLTVLGLQTTVLMGTGDNRRTILLKPIYVRLGTSKAAALPGSHCLTGCDTCGHIDV